MFGCVNDSHLVFHNSFRHCRNNNLSWSVTKTSTFKWTQRSQPESPQREYFAATAAVSQLPAEVIYWTDLKTFTHPHIGPGFTLNRFSLNVQLKAVKCQVGMKGLSHMSCVSCDNHCHCEVSAHTLGYFNEEIFLMRGVLKVNLKR